MSPFEKGHKGFAKKPVVPAESIEIPENFKNETEATQPEPNQESAEPQTFVIKTENDAYIHSRLQSSPKTLADIKVRQIDEESAASHMLKLPKPIKEALDKNGLVPRWINKDKRMIDRALDVRGWNIFNRSYFPNVPRHYFTANGTVENGDTILGFMPAERAERLRSRPGEISQERIKNLPIESYKGARGDEKIGYYKPALTAEPDGKQESNVGLYATPDATNNE